MDAAVAAAAALFVVLPDACGVGGDALLLVATQKDTTALNGTGTAPASLPSSIPEDGSATATVPGAISALCAAHERFGHVPLERVLRPAVRLAKDGFPMSERLYEAIAAHGVRLRRGAEGWKLLEPQLSPGAIVRQPELAEVLAAVAEDGPTALYFGQRAEAVAAAVRRDGGSMVAADLGSYETLIAEPVCVDFEGARIEVSPPSSQGILLLIALRWLARMGHAPLGVERLHCQIEAIEAAFEHRDDIAADGAERLLSDEAIAQLAVSRGVAARRGGPRGYNHTSAVAAGDASGTLVSGLVSVFDNFGCATLVPELGFLLNSRLLGFGSGSNRPRPAARPVHTLVPAMARHESGSIALATPGADGQVQTLLQVLSLLFEDGLELQESLELPRWRSVEGSVFVERGFDPELLDELAARGHDIRLAEFGDELFGAVAAVRASGESISAASDPRREVWAGGL